MIGAMAGLVICGEDRKRVDQAAVLDSLPGKQPVLHANYFLVLSFYRFDDLQI